MKIKEQTRKLVVAVLEHGKVKLMWFKEILEEYKNSALLENNENAG